MAIRTTADEKRAPRPAPTGLSHTRAPGGLERAARGGQAVAALTAGTGRPVPWLALVLCAHHVRDPASMRRAYARAYLAAIGAMLAMCGDHRSGRRSRPGHQATAAIAGCAEQTAERWWARLAALFLIELVTPGGLRRPGDRLVSGTPDLRGRARRPVEAVGAAPAP